MTAATRLIWDLAGHPEPTVPLTNGEGVCAICNTHAPATAHPDKVLGTNFTDRGLIRRNTPHVCAACAWCILGRPPRSLRMWSIIAAPGHPTPPSHEKAFLQNTPGLALLNRSNPGPIADMLTTPPTGPWLITIAYSGQKHVAPYGHVNHGPGRWSIRVEDHYVTSTPETWRAVRHAAAELRRAKIPADAIREGRAPLMRDRAQLDHWTEHNTTLTPYHRSPLLDLALWTLTKGTL